MRILNALVFFFSVTSNKEFGECEKEIEGECLLFENRKEIWTNAISDLS